MRRGFAAVGLCLLLLLSGCSFLSGGNDAGQTPGVEDGELADGDALIEAHVTALTASGYTHEVTVNQTRTRDSERVENVQRQRMRVAPEATEYERQLIYGGAVSSRIVAWGNDSVEYLRIERGDNVEYRRSSPGSAEAMTGARIIEPHLSAPFEVVDTETDDDRTLVTLEATGPPSNDRAFPQAAEDVERYEARLVVDADGRIHRLEASADYVLEGEAADYDLTYELTGTGDPGVQRPQWVADVEA
jgi:hypothetical protein